MSTDLDHELDCEANKWFNLLSKEDRQNIINTQYRLSISSIKIHNNDIINDMNRQIETLKYENKILREENGVISRTNGFQMLEEKVRQRMTQIEDKISQDISNTSLYLEKFLTDGTHKIELKLVETSKCLEKQVTNGYTQVLTSHNQLEQKLTTNHSKGIIGENMIQDHFSKIPGCTIYNVTRDRDDCDFKVKFDELNIMIESKNVLSVTPEHTNRFESDVCNAIPAVDFGIFVAQRSKWVNSAVFSLKIINMVNHCVFLFYVSDVFSNPDRLTSALKIGKILVDNYKMNKDIHKDAQEIIAKISEIYTEIETLYDNSTSMKKSIKNIEDIIINNDKSIDNLLVAIKQLAGSRQSKPLIDPKEKLCLDIVKRFMLNNVKFQLRDVIEKAVEFHVVESQAKSIINKFGGITKIRQNIQQLIDNGDNSCFVHF